MPSHKGEVPEGATPGEVLRIHLDMYEGITAEYRERKANVDTTDGAGKKERAKLQEKIQTYADKHDALHWYGLDAGLIEPKFSRKEKR